jgi:hypothetical protein
MRQKSDKRVWTVFMWFRIGSSGDSARNRNENSDPVKGRKFLV